MTKFSLRFGALKAALWLAWKGKRSCRALAIVLLVSSLLGTSRSPAQAQAAPYCQLSAEVVAQTNALRQAALQGDPNAQQSYQSLIAEQSSQLRQCRSQSWLQSQAIWLRLYPCDVRPGALDELFDRMLSRGYNEVYLEVFYDGLVLLPSADNHTSWPSVIRTPGYETVDLLSQAIAKGHERGMKVYAWMFTLNFGYTYSQRPGADQVLARNGRGDTSLTFRAKDENGEGETVSNEAFVDPYSLQARRDYYALVQSILKRRPDGVLFDYVRYPRGTGSDSVASGVKDLWIYGSAAQQAFYERAQNQKGLDLIRRFLTQGQITTADLSAVNSLYAQEQEPLWQGRTPTHKSNPASAAIRDRLQQELWRLSVAHAVQGVLDFLSMALLPVQQRGLAAGAVFFPDANQMVGQQGYDSRLQPWDRFPNTIEWHPMAYGTCGTTDCIVDQVKRVASLAPATTQIEPAIAGTWGQVLNGRPSLEAQMQSIRQAVPQVKSISHFSLAWQEPEADRARKFCQLR